MNKVDETTIITFSQSQVEKNVKLRIENTGIGADFSLLLWMQNTSSLSVPYL